MLFFIILFVEDLWNSIETWVGRISVAIIILCLMHYQEIQQQLTTTITSITKSLSNHRLGRNEKSIGNNNNNNTEIIINEDDMKHNVDELEQQRQRNDDNVDDNDLYDYGLEEEEEEDIDDDINLDLGLEDDDDDKEIDNINNHNDETIQPITNNHHSLSSSSKNPQQSQVDEQEETTPELLLQQQQRQKQFIKEMTIIGQSSSSQQDYKIAHADGLNITPNEPISSSAGTSSNNFADVDNSSNDISSSKERTNKTIDRLKQKQLEMKLKKKKQEEELEQKEKDAAKLFTAITSDDKHPGLDQFHHWYNTETSLFREYTLYPKNNNNIIIPGIRSKHNNGMNSNKDDIHSQIELRIGNTLSYSIAIYWIDHYGKANYKGIIESYHTWIHITYLYHPFIICRIDNLDNINNIDEQTMILHYIPYRIIPNVLPEAPTMNPNNNISIHQFALIPTPSYTNNIHDYNDYYCWIHDPILPYSSKETFITPRDAIGFALLHSYRMQYIHWNTIMKYITKIVMNPNQHNIIYRIIKISNSTFMKCIWNYTCIRGIFYAIGFIENNNGYLQIGTSSTDSLSRERIQDLSQLLLAFELWQKRQQQG